MSVEKGFPFHTVFDHFINTGSLHIGYLFEPAGPPGIQVHLLLPSRRTVPSESIIVAFFDILLGAADMALSIFSSSLISSAVATGVNASANSAAMMLFIRLPISKIKVENVGELVEANRQCISTPYAA